MEKFILHAVLVSSLFVCGVFGTVWNHDVTDNVNGQLHWVTTYPECGLTSQSPIHIWTNTTHYCNELSAFEFVISDSDSNLTLTNTGHGAKISYASVKPTISGGGLPGTYELQEIHFHTGNGSDRGSEHLIDSDDYIGEVHFVFYNMEVNASDVLTSTNPPGLAVLAVLLQRGTDLDFHSSWDVFLNHFEDIAFLDNTTDIVDNIDIQNLLRDADRYFRYNGSLTTPPCSEVVVWSVLETSAHLSSSQVTKLLGIEHEPTPNTYRLPQPLNDRMVKSSFTDDVATTSSTAVDITSSDAVDINTPHFVTLCTFVFFWRFM